MSPKDLLKAIVPVDVNIERHARKCGCYFALVEDPESRGHREMVCPLHSCASRLLERLKIEHDPHHSYFDVGCETCRLIAEVDI